VGAPARHRGLRGWLGRQPQRQRQAPRRSRGRVPLLRHLTLRAPAHQWVSGIMVAFASPLWQRPPRRLSTCLHAGDCIGPCDHVILCCGRGEWVRHAANATTVSGHTVTLHLAKTSQRGVPTALRYACKQLDPPRSHPRASTKQKHFRALCRGAV
jgi:hypothetical protein